MSLSKLTKKTLTVSRGFTYTYFVSPAHDSKPSIILFHGWPDTAQLWSGLINDYLLPQGYGLVALDCLGYGGTSKPTDPKFYSWRDMSTDAIEILDAEQLPSVITLGHDWGSVLAARLYNFHPTRVQGVVTINIAYLPPTGQFNLDAANAMTRQDCGYALYEYWYLFTSDDGIRIMNQNLESVYCMAFGDPPTWLETMAAPDGARKFVSEGQTQPTLPFATAEHKKDFMDRLSQEGGFAAPSCWYRSLTTGLQNEVEQQVPDEHKVIKVPVLFWGGEGDAVGRPDRLKLPIDAGLLPDVKSITREGGHWALLEHPDVFGQDVVDWLHERFA
ncbi:Bifunctional epoxide hydrolase 2 [Penicillium rolfsii]|nr:Bifunctional epoxide hydrolase 2 [Penicillium rolfsii]